MSKTIFNQKISIAFAIIVTMLLLISVVPQLAYAEELNLFLWPERGAHIGEQITDSGQPVGDNPFYLTEGATYSCVSSNENIVKVSIGPNMSVSGYGTTVFGSVKLYGVSAGVATINLRQTLNGQTTNAGTMKITVYDPVLTANGNYKHEFGLGNQGSGLEVENRNNNAIYTFEIDKEGLTMVEEKDPKGWININMNATKYGTYTVSAYETVNGVKKKMKDMTFHIKEMIIPDTYTYDPDKTNTNEVNVSNFIQYPNKDYVYGVNIPGDNYSFWMGGSMIANNNPDSPYKNHRDLDVYTIAPKNQPKLGALQFNKAVTVQVELYRLPRYYGDDDIPELIKTMTMNYKGEYQ